MCDLNPREKGNTCSTNCLVGFVTKKNKIWWYNNSPPYKMARWPPRQIPFSWASCCTVLENSTSCHWPTDIEGRSENLCNFDPGMGFKFWVFGLVHNCVEPGQFTLITMGLIRYSCDHILGPHQPIPTKFGLWMFLIMLHRYMVSKTLKCKKVYCDVITSVLYLVIPF